MTNEQQRPPARTTKNSPSAVTLAISVLTHLLLLAPVIYIVVLAFQHYSLFAWHVILPTVGIALLMLEGIFAISGDAYVSSKVKRKNRVILHWLLHGVGLGMMVAGVIIIIVMKGNRAHFTSTHGKLGLAAMILGLLMLISSPVADNTKWLYPRVKPVTIKIFHAVSGILVMIVMLAAVINGTYTRWWPGTEVGRDLTFASFVFGTMLIMIKPILGAVSRSKFVFRKAPAST